VAIKIERDKNRKIDIFGDIDRKNKDGVFVLQADQAAREAPNMMPLW